MLFGAALVEAVDFAAVDLPAAVFAAVDFAAVDVAAVVFAAVVLAAVVFAADLAAVDVAAVDFAAAERVERGLAAGLEGPSESFAAAALRAAARALVVPRDARGAADDPPSADTSVPVPSGCSSFWSERETEVTTQTYQSPPREPSRDVTPVTRSEPVHRLCSASRSRYDHVKGSARQAPSGYPETRHNGVSTFELPDERGGNARQRAPVASDH
ncbi:hypothetical protein [Agromyces humi]|uniref:hypothetical protein n=1 Tax=Agromyces humi TaxID=1766800 RepID=UPI00135B9754|nr:hypothetical protein [Agromyces humi]